MTPSARIEIGNRGGFRSGVLYTELGPTLEELFGQGKAAVAFHTGTSLIVGRSDPGAGICWANDHAPITGIRSTLAPQNEHSS